MKIAHSNIKSNKGKSYIELISEAKEQESSDPENALILYETATKMRPYEKEPFNRMMILHRKNKDAKKEIALIRFAIKTFQKHYTANKKGSSGTIAKLSKALMKSVGLADSKGKNIYEPEPIPTWRKREELLLKRINKK